MKKKLTALFLAVVMCMTMSAPAFAVESTSVAAMEKAAYEDMIRAEIRRQLEAQDAMELYDAFEDILIPSDDQVYGTRAASARYSARNGGITAFKRDVEYRGELLTYQYSITHLDYDDSQELIDRRNATIDVIEFMRDVFGNEINAVLGSLAPWVNGLIDFAIIGANFSTDLIDDAGGYARIVTVDTYDSCGTVVAGWEGYPYAEIDYSDAYECSFAALPAN